MRKLLEAEYANQQLERARQRLQGHREGMQDAIRMNAEQLAQQKKSEADVLREQSRRISAYVAMQQQQHVERAKRISSVSVPASRREGKPRPVLWTRARSKPCLLLIAACADLPVPLSLRR